MFIRRISAIVGFWMMAPVSVGGTSAHSVAAQAPVVNQAKLASWHQYMHQQIHQAVQQRAGCFVSSYPDTVWHEVNCKAPSAIRPVPVRRHTARATSRGSAIGYGGSGYTLVAPTGAIIASATVAFLNATNVHAITDIGQPLNGSVGAGVNNFTLQLNTNDVPISNNQYCKKKCQVWLQFYLANGQKYVTPANPTANLTMQAWVLTDDKTDCQSGWWFSQAPGSASGCYRNYNSLSLPQGLLPTDLGSTTMTADVEGGMVHVTLNVGAKSYLLSDQDYTNIESGWNEYDFNIYGNGGGSFLVLNRGASMDVNMAADYGSTTPPTCLQGSSTEESNNMQSGSCQVLSTQPPSIQFREYVP